ALPGVCRPGVAAGAVGDLVGAQDWLPLWSRAGLHSTEHVCNSSHSGVNTSFRAVCDVNGQGSADWISPLEEWTRGRYTETGPGRVGVEPTGIPKTKLLRPKRQS